MALAPEVSLSGIPSSETLRTAIHLAQQCLLNRQAPTGEWCGELEGDSILESEFILLMQSLGKIHDPLTLRIARYLRKLQNDSGGWSIYPGAPDDVSATVKSYFALKLIGDDPSAPHMLRASDAALSLG